MGRALFITGTGTDVGKTSLSLAVLLWARKSGLSAAYHKPIQCGTSSIGEPPVQGGDADWIRFQAEGAMPGHAQPTEVTYQLHLAASPHLAAEREGLTVDLGRIRRDLESLLDWHDLVVVEGAGGPAVPVNRNGGTLGALAAELSIPCLIACAPGLGTLHHTLSTVAYLKTLNAPIAGFAFCHREAKVPELCGDNVHTLKDLTGLPFFGELPFSDKLSRRGTLAPDEADTWSTPLAEALEAWWKLKGK